MPSTKPWNWTRSEVACECHPLHLADDLPPRLPSTLYPLPRCNFYSDLPSTLYPNARAEEGDAMQKALYSITKQNTVPNIFIGGNHVGGCDDLHALHAQGKLEPQLKKK